MTPVLTQKNGVVAEGLQLGNKKKQKRLKEGPSQGFSLPFTREQKLPKRF
jgi:hypothetical protein